MRQMFNTVACGVLAASLVACGGGGGSAGTTGATGTTGSTGGSTSGTTTGSAAVADFALFTDKSTLTNTGSDSAKLTIVAVDANRNVVPNATVTVSTDQNSVYVPTSTTTDANGSVTGQIQLGGDKTDRVVTVTATVNGITKRTTVAITGSKLTVSATPSSPSPGQSVALTATLLDAGGTPIVGKTITFGGTVPGVANTTGVTNSAGQVAVNFAAPSAAGAYTITSSGSGTTSADLQLNVFNSAVPAAAIPSGTAPSLAVSPNVLSVNSVGSTTNKAALRFLLVDSSNRPVQNVRVRFDDMTTGLPKVGASISSGTTTLFTDASGTVTAQYIAGQNSSPTNGVTVRACYSPTDFASTTDCPNQVTAALTVAGQALAVSIGDDNLLESVSGTYIKRFAVTVADSAGRAVANAPVDISVDLTHYSKGNFSDPFVGAASDPLSSVPLDLFTANPNFTTDASTARQRIWCPNEDANRNGIVDATSAFPSSGSATENYNGSVDSNGQPTLEPRKSDLLVSFDNPSVTSTDASGVVIIKVQYSQRFATWLAYKLRVTANVSGSQGLAERLFVTNALEADRPNGSFLTPPYGVHRCIDPN